MIIVTLETLMMIHINTICYFCAYSEPTEHPGRRVHAPHAPEALGLAGFCLSEVADKHSNTNFGGCNRPDLSTESLGIPKAVIPSPRRRYLQRKAACCRSKNQPAHTSMNFEGSTNGGFIPQA